MKQLTKVIKSVLAGLVILAVASPALWARESDTSFAVEFSYSCLSGGCHELDQKLVDEYAASKMTHTMVKCNACHGTHAADTVGLEKPNLTGYYPGIGATGYAVDTDRCRVCHNNEHTGEGNKSDDNCYSCHTPHVFAPPGSGSR